MINRKRAAICFLWFVTFFWAFFSTVSINWSEKKNLPLLFNNHSPALLNGILYFGSLFVLAFLIGYFFSTNLGLNILLIRIKREHWAHKAFKNLACITLLFLLAFSVSDILFHLIHGFNLSVFFHQYFLIAFSIEILTIFLFFFLTGACYILLYFITLSKIISFFAVTILFSILTIMDIKFYPIGMTFNALNIFDDVLLAEKFYFLRYFTILAKAGIMIVLLFCASVLISKKRNIIL